MVLANLKLVSQVKNNIIITIYLSVNYLDTGLKEFLDESAIKLQKVFDNSCGFLNSNDCLLDKVEDVFREVSSMKVSAEKFRQAAYDTDLLGGARDSGMV